MADTTEAREAAGVNATLRDRRYRDFAHTGPGTIAGKFMRTFWQPVYRSEDLPKGKAKPLKIMSEELTLYRGETGAPHLVGARCKHRGALLSVGWVEGDDIRCFYHGWSYGPDGRCVEQPAEPKPFCADVKVVSYPVREYLGLVFAYMGEGEPPDLPRYAAFEDEDAFRMVTINYRGVNFFQDFENGMDRVHGGFVHRTRPKSFDGRVDSPVMDAEEDSWGLKTIARHPSGMVGIQSFGMPNKQHIKDTFSQRENFIWKVPVDDENTAHFRVTVAKGAEAIEREKRLLREREQRPQLDAFELAREIVAGKFTCDDVDPLTTEMVWLEDDVALLAQGVIAERENEHEYLGASDAPIVLLRNLWAREMRAMDLGKPMKDWIYDPASQQQRRPEVEKT